MQILLLILDQFERYFFAGLVVDALQSRSETAFAKELDDFESVTDVVAQLVLVISVLFIEAKVELAVPCPLDFRRRGQADEVNIRVLLDLCFFIIRKQVSVVSQSFLGLHRKLRNFLLHNLRLEGKHSAHATLAIAGVGAEAVCTLVRAVRVCIPVISTGTYECTDLILFTRSAGIAGGHNASVSDFILIYLLPWSVFLLTHIKKFFLRVNSVYNLFRLLLFGF